MKQEYVEMDFAKLDTSRKERTGFLEVVFCSGKTNEYLLDIYKKLLEEDGEVFGTRATEEQFEFVKREIPEIKYNKVSKILKFEKRRQGKDW